MSGTIRIGTRGSALALWQATTVKKALERQGYHTETVIVESTGDRIQDKPLYEMGITGIFTRHLDLALLENRIDIAVHSMKDVPTRLPDGISASAVLERGTPDDLWVPGPGAPEDLPPVMATGSPRRKAQWLARNPDWQVVDLRGNVGTRLRKLRESHWRGAVFAAAGLERLGNRPDGAVPINWMVPAPAQGAILVCGREGGGFEKALETLDHPDSRYAVTVERAFLRALEGGCTAPIGAHLQIKDRTVHFKGCLHLPDGSGQATIERTGPWTPEKGDEWGHELAEAVLANGGKAIMDAIRDTDRPVDQGA